MTGKPINWVGFYLLDQDHASSSSVPRKESLILGPFQGKVACTTIEFGRGVCGTAAQENRTLLIKDVHEFPGHIACDAATNSEIVVPLELDGVGGHICLSFDLIRVCVQSGLGTNSMFLVNCFPFDVK